MNTQWVILVSIVSLVVSVEVGEHSAPSDLTQNILCCDIETLEPEKFVKDPPNCNESTQKKATEEKNDDTAESTQKESTEEKNATEESCNVLECILKENGLLNEDNSENEQKLRDFFVKGGKPEARSTWSTAMDNCFKDDNKNSDNKEEKMCKSKVGQRFSCVMKEVIKNCPPTFWDRKRVGCEIPKQDADKKQ